MTNKTVPTGASVTEFLNAVDHAGRREDASVLLDMMRRVTGAEPRMWGQSIIGFGNYRYKYESGREGVFLLTGFSPRKARMTIYIMPGFKAYSEYLSRLGRHKHSVSCLYVGRLAALDLEVLEEMVADSVRRMKEIYPDWWL